jgi:hypothetical protein
MVIFRWGVLELWGFVKNGIVNGVTNICTYCQLMKKKSQFFTVTWFYLGFICLRQTVSEMRKLFTFYLLATYLQFYCQLV